MESTPTNYSPSIPAFPAVQVPSSAFTNKIIISSIQWRNAAGGRSYSDPFRLSVHFEVREELNPGEFEIKILYVGSTEEKEDGDLVLEEATVENFKVGVPSELTLEFDPPDPSEIDEDLVHGITNILVVFSWQDQPWMRVAYYVANMYNDETLDLCPPDPPLVHNLTRTIHDGELRSVMTWPIAWEKEKPSNLLVCDGSDSGYSTPSTIICSAPPSKFTDDRMLLTDSDGINYRRGDLIVKQDMTDIDTDMDIDGH